MPSDEAITYQAFGEGHLDSVLELCRELSWPSYVDMSNAVRVFSAPGTVTWVAVSGTAVVGLAHLLTDGLIQAHLSLVGVLPDYRRKGLARRLIREAFRTSGARWLDLAAEPGSEAFYRSFVHTECVGFRIYPGEPVP